MDDFKRKNVIDMHVKESDWEEFPCQQCGNQFFEEKIVANRLSMFKSPTGKAEFRFSKVILCPQCGWIIGAPVDEELKKSIDQQRAMAEKMRGMMMVGDPDDDPDDDLEDEGQIENVELVIGEEPSSDSNILQFKPKG